MNESPSTKVADSKGDEGGIMATIITTSENLKAIDRCVRCGGQAYVHAFLLSGADLLFCCHHAAEHWDKLVQDCETIMDERSRLTAQEAQPRDAGSTI